MTLIIRLIDRAVHELSKTPLIVLVRLLGNKISKDTASWSSLVCCVVCSGLIFDGDATQNNSDIHLKKSAEMYVV